MPMHKHADAGNVLRVKPLIQEFGMFLQLRLGLLHHSPGVLNSGRPQHIGARLLFALARS